MKLHPFTAIAAIAGTIFVFVPIRPAQANLVLADGPDQGSFTNNFGFGANGSGTTANPNANYFSGSGTEAYTSHLNNAPVAILFVFGPNGEISTYRDSSVGTYDNVEDTQIGVLNLSGTTLTSFKLTATSGNPFGFDGDGISDTVGANTGSSATGAGAPSNSHDTSSGLYGGPMTYFTLNAPGSSGNFSNSGSLTAYANFVGGLANGASTYFSLEGNPGNLGNLGGGGGTFATPEPASVTMALSGALMALVYRARHRKLRREKGGIPN